MFNDKMLNEVPLNNVSVKAEEAVVDTGRSMKEER